jgi:predicted O-methyltransferase YrrM
MFESNRLYTENKIPADIFPLIVKPNTLTCSLGITRDSIVNDHKTLENQLEIIFQRFRELKEIRVEKFIENAREFTVSVIGNSEAFYTSVTELIFDNVGPHVYGEEEKKKNIESRPVKYNLIDDTKIKEELIFHAKRLFNWFGMRDMGRFDFLYDTRAYIIDVNALPVSGNSLSWEWQKKFNIGKKMGLAFYLAAFHFRQMASGRPDPLPNSLLNTLPEEILRNIHNPRPLLSVPESTTPNEHCRKPHLFTMINRVSAETEVLQFLKALVMLVKPSLIIETGTFKGATAAAMVCGLLENGYGKLVTIELDETLAKRSARKFQGFPVEVVCGSSLTYTPDDKIDMLFIDSHRAIRGKEFEHFKPHLRDNAIIVWHDSAPEHTAVFEAVNDLYDNQVIDRILLPTPRGLTISMLKKVA